MIKWYQKWSGIWILKKYAFYSFISGYVTIYACMIFELIKTKKMKFYSTVTICIDEKNQTFKIEEYLSYLVNRYTYVWFNAFVSYLTTDKEDSRQVYASPLLCTCNCRTWLRYTGLVYFFCLYFQTVTYSGKKNQSDFCWLTPMHFCLEWRP